MTSAEQNEKVLLHIGSGHIIEVSKEDAERILRKWRDDYNGRAE